MPYNRRYTTPIEPSHRFKVGDRVKITQSPIFTNELIGKTATITEWHERVGTWHYNIDIDNNHCRWFDDDFELAEEQVREKIVCDIFSHHKEYCV
jgi:hypothetical protein